MDDMSYSYPVSQIVFVFNYLPRGGKKRARRSLEVTQTLQNTADSSGLTTETPYKVFNVSLKMRTLAAWLQLHHQLHHELEPLTSLNLPSNSQNLDSEAPHYYRLDPHQIGAHRTAVIALHFPVASSSLIYYGEDDTRNAIPAVLVVQINVERGTRMNWATKLGNDILGSKLMTLAKLEHSKAVTATLGGAYATMQRAGWARLYARRTLALARASGDATLEIRAKIYLKICKIISILHPSFASRHVYRDELHGTTTLTNTNAHAFEAHKPSQEEHERLRTELDSLMSQASDSDDESLVGMIAYAKFRLESAGVAKES
jgi:phage gp46-like protein